MYATKEIALNTDLNTVCSTNCGVDRRYFYSLLHDFYVTPADVIITTKMLHHVWLLVRCEVIGKFASCFTIIQFFLWADAFVRSDVEQKQEFSLFNLYSLD